MKYRVLLLLLVGFAVVFAAGEYVPLVGSKILSFNITDDADTARVVTITPDYALDSFHYHCSLSFQADTSSWDTVSWTSPLQSITITPGVENSFAYGCTLILVDPTPDESLYFEWTSPASNTTIDTVLDSLVHYFNNTTDLEDSVLAAEDGSTITVTLKFSEITLGTRVKWAFGDSLKDTASVETDVAMVCDGMVAAINASDSAAFFTAYDSTTEYIVQSDKKGLTFHIAPTDTVQDDDSATTQENVMSNSSDSGTVSLDKVRGFKHLDGIIVLVPGPYSAMSVGNSDSAIVTLYSVGPEGRKIITVDTCPQVPCTCDVMIHSNVGDTALERQIEFHWWVNDTLSDTDLTVNIPAWWDLQLK